MAIEPETEQLIARFTQVLGRPVATPEWIMSCDFEETRRKERARYRVWRFPCPVCCAHLEDPDGIYLPLAVDSRGECWCEEGCDEMQIANHVRHLIAVEQLLEDVRAAR